MRSVMLDTLADGASAAGVAASGAIILIVGGVYWLDSAVALAIAAIIAYRALKLIRDVLIHFASNIVVTSTRRVGLARAERGDARSVGVSRVG